MTNRLQLQSQCFERLVITVWLRISTHHRLQLSSRLTLHAVDAVSWQEPYACGQQGLRRAGRTCVTCFLATPRQCHSEQANCQVLTCTKSYMLLCSKSLCRPVSSSHAFASLSSPQHNCVSRAATRASDSMTWGCYLQAHPLVVGPSSRCGTRHHTCHTAGYASCPRPPSTHSTPPKEQMACRATYLHTSPTTMM